MAPKTRKTRREHLVVLTATTVRLLYSWRVRIGLVVAAPSLNADHLASRELIESVGVAWF